MKNKSVIQMIFSAKRMLRALLTGMAVILLSGAFIPLQAAEDFVPERTAISLGTGYTYDPSEDICFMQVSLFKIYDYESIWKHNAPAGLRFKFEAGLGAARLKNGDVRAMANAGIMALLYLDRLQSDVFIPYIEAGVGVIFSDYQVMGQDYRFNFNPQAGFGIEFKHKPSGNPFVALRAHHVSNGGVGSTNRGLNSVVLMFGRHF